MKAISIITSIMVLAWQISSTFAQDMIAANPDFATTEDGQRVNINVIANDIFADCRFIELVFESIIKLSEPEIVQGNGVTGAGFATIDGAALGTVNYFPVPGFVGKITFEYTIQLGGARRGLRDRRLQSFILTGIVTVTVLAIEDQPEEIRPEEIRPVYKIENQVSTETALNLVNLFNVDLAAAAAAVRLTAGGGV
jgi:hypothetical protein